MASLSERAEQLSAKRSRILIAVSFIYITQQFSYFHQDQSGRAVDTAQVLGWVLLSVVMLGVLLTNGNWFLSKELRVLLDDEVTQANRARATRAALTAAMVGGFALYAFAPSLDWGVRETVHAIVSIGLAAGFIALAFFEKRSAAHD